MNDNPEADRPRGSDVRINNTPTSTAGKPSPQDQAPERERLAEHAAAIRQLGKRVVADVIEIGRHLTEAKQLCGHGHWLPWLHREFGWGETTALRFMRVRELAQSKSGRLPDLPVSGLYLLAAPSTPEEARAAVIERAEAGPVPVAEVKGIIAIAKARQQPAKKRHRVNPKPAPKPDPSRSIRGCLFAVKVAVERALVAKRGDAEHQRLVFESVRRCLTEMEEARAEVAA